MKVLPILNRINIKENITIGYMLQEDALFPWLTIYENAILGLKISKKLNSWNRMIITIKTITKPT